MRREDLEHVLRAASVIADEREVVVMGSQSVLGVLPEVMLPLAATASAEADVAFLDDPQRSKADAVDGAIGELSAFHSTFGYYADGISIELPTLPSGWRERLVPFENENTQPARGLCLEPHDCVVAKLIAGREKDLTFAGALLRARLVDPRVLHERVDQVDLPEDRRRGLHSLVDALVR